MHLAPGGLLSYPLGRADNTHFDELGICKMAQLVVNDLHAQLLPLPKNAVAAPTGAATQPTTP